MRKRGLVCFILSIVLFFVSALRVATVAISDYSAVNSTQNGIRLNIGKSRGTIYDCNRVRLTNSEERIIACISPTPRAITAISQVLKGDELVDVLEILKSNKPVLCEVPKKIDCDGSVCTTIYTDRNNVSRHIIGYTDSDNKGISGIEKAYDSILYSEDDVSVFYNTDAKGRILEGIAPQLKNNNKALTNGVVTTLDINIQALSEELAINLEKGAIVVADAKTNKIKSLVSRPYFDKNNVSIYLDSESQPLFNRAINSYNVGSAFKPCVAITGIEQKLGGYQYNCTGSTEIIDRYFKCHKLSGHGLLDLKGGLAFSCNTFFYNFSAAIGGKEILNTSKKLSFGQQLKLCDGIYTSKGSLPNLESLNNIAHLANFSIGQGELLLSPVSILTLYSAIATNGQYYIPSIVEGTIDGSNFKEYNKGLPTNAFDEKTALAVRDYLKSVLDEGTGQSAKPKTVSAAGKTATAQTGKFVNSEEISESWFCGFFPFEDPKYVVVVFSEDDQKQALSCSEIFARLADGIMEIDDF